MRITSGELSLAAILVVLVVPVVVALWRGAAKIRDNTSAVERLATVVEGSAIAIGLSARVRVLEDWRIATEAAEAAQAATAKAGP